MKLVKNASGKNAIKLTESEWLNIGKKNGWTEISEMTDKKASTPIKLIKKANGKFALKMGRSEWEKIGKEAGWWDNVKQVGKGIGQGVQGVGNAVGGVAGLLGNAIKGIFNQVQQLRQQTQQGQVQPAEVQQLQQLQSEIQMAIQEAEASLSKYNAQDVLRQNSPATA